MPDKKSKKLFAKKWQNVAAIDFLIVYSRFLIDTV